MQRFWERWLSAVAWLTAILGLLLALLTGTPALAFVESPLLRAIFGDAALTPEMRTFHRWVFGVAGAVMMGWGIGAIFVVRHGIQKGERWAWTCLALSVGLWYAVDTSISAFYGVWANVIGNTGFLLLYEVPLVALAPRFLGRRPAALHGETPAPAGRS